MSGDPRLGASEVMTAASEITTDGEWVSLAAIVNRCGGLDAPEFEHMS